MTQSTGEFRISALAGKGIQLQRDSGSQSSSRQTLTAEPSPLVFVLNFANGDRLIIAMHGSGQEPSSFWQVMARVKRLAELATNWDSYGAQPLSPVAVKKGLSILPSLLVDEVITPTVVPSRDGGLQFEWHRLGIDVEMKIPPVGPESYYLADASAGTELEWEGSDNPDAIRSALARLSRPA